MTCLAREYPGFLDDVATVAEVAKRWGLNRRSVEYRIWRGDIAARQSGRVWLVYLPSVRVVYGEERAQQ